MNYLESFYLAKYHFSIVKRMLESYELFPDKRLIIGIINESAISAANLIKSYVLFDGFRGKDVVLSFSNIFHKYMKKEVFESVIALLEIEKAQKTTPVEFQKNDRMIFLVEGRYKILIINRLKEFISNLGEAIGNFPIS